MNLPTRHAPLEAGGLDAAIALLEALPDRAGLLRAATGILRHWTGCEAVGVRLRQGDDFPYCTNSGFPERFVLAENSLCCLDADGNPRRDAAGRPVLECLCGRVLTGDVDPARPYFTERGSFYTPSTTELLARAAPGELGPTRNRCQHAGYETVVLTPLLAGGTTFGLIQVNDRRRGRLGLASLERLERLADGLAMVLAHQDMEAELAAAEARYRAVFAANIAVKLLIDPETGRIVDANPAACAFYGYDAAAMCRLSIWDINTLPEAEVRESMALVAAGAGEVFRFPHRLADGAVRQVEVYSGPVALAGRKLLFSIIHDVTERSRAEEARDRAEQILRHDLRSPLTGIVGLAGHLLKKELDPSIREPLSAIHEAAERLHGLVGRNLDLCKIEQGSYRIAPGPVALADLLRGQVREAANLARGRGLALRLGGDGLDRPGPGHPLVAGESALLGTLFSNLVTNALEAAPAGSNVTIGVVAAGTEALVTLHNLGVVPEDIRPRFFTKYATSGKRHGTGLGAYIARKIARLHGGDIDWSSSPSLGTRLTVRLPLHGG